MTRRAPLFSPLSSLGATAALAAIALGVSSCSLSPLNHRIKIGEESFVVFVGEGIDGNTDLFAAPAAGGEVVQFTYTPLIEWHPRLDSAGDVVAFFRMRDTLPATPRFVVFMNLASGGEVQIALPTAAGRPEMLAWSHDSRQLYLRTDRDIWTLAAPPQPLHLSIVGAGERAAADSALDTWLGDPPFARAIPCANGGVCVIGLRGDTATLSEHGHDAMRWGADSVAWFDGSDLLARSLGPGREHRVAWTNLPRNPRDGSYAEVAGGNSQ